MPCQQIASTPAVAIKIQTLRVLLLLACSSLATSSLPGQSSHPLSICQVPMFFFLPRSPPEWNTTIPFAYFSSSSPPDFGMPNLPEPGHYHSENSMRLRWRLAWKRSLLLFLSDARCCPQKKIRSLAGRASTSISRFPRLTLVLFLWKDGLASVWSVSVGRCERYKLIL